MAEEKKELRFLVTGDLHYRSENPPARLDNYSEAITAKLLDIKNMAEKFAVNAIIIPGDITDSASISLPTIRRLALVLNKFTCPVLAIPGGHDEFGHNLQTIPRTPYGLLSELSFFRCLHDATLQQNPVSYYGEFVNAILTGHGFNTDTDRDLEQYALPEFIPKLKFDIEPTSVFIHVVHGLVMDEDPGGIERFTPVSRLAEIPANRQPHVLICGHYHFGLKSQRIGRTLIINTGAIARVKAHFRELSRPVQVALLRIRSTEDYDVEFLPLPSALPGEKVLSRKHIEIEKIRKEKMDRFMTLLTSEGREDFTAIRDIVEDVAGRKNIPAQVKKETLKWITRAGEEMARKKRGKRA